MNAVVRQGALVLAGDLDFEARREFMVQTQSAIERGEPAVRLNCSTVGDVGPVDDGVIGMLVGLARAAQSRGARIVLDRAPKLMRTQFEAAGLAHRFEWRG
jgi:ABC-type transporter Mla MlaB component